MTLTLAGRDFRKAAIIDDDPYARDSLKYTVEDMSLDVVLESHPGPDLDKFVDRLAIDANVVLCDYHLQKHNYASFDGDDVVEACYKRKLPAVLTTQFSDFDVTLMRRKRRSIPKILRSDEPDFDELRDGWLRCLEEFDEIFRPDRKAWRSLVRIYEVDQNNGFFYAVIPAWDPREKVRLSMDDVDDAVLGVIEEGRRLHALVNTGAACHEELFFYGWERE